MCLIFMCLMCVYFHVNILHVWHDSMGLTFVGATMHPRVRFRQRSLRRKAYARASVCVEFNEKKKVALFLALIHAFHIADSSIYHIAQRPIKHSGVMHAKSARMWALRRSD